MDEKLADRLFYRIVRIEYITKLTKRITLMLIYSKCTKEIFQLNQAVCNE